MNTRFHFFRRAKPVSRMYLWLALLVVGCSGRVATPVVPSAAPSSSPAAILPQTSGGTPTPAPTTAIQNNSPAATDEATALPEGVLYSDNFENAESGWPRDEFDNYFTGYHEPTYYHVQIRDPNDRALAAIPEQSFEDFTLEAEIFAEGTMTAESGDFRYGVMLRRSGQLYYAFVLSPITGTWSFLKSTRDHIETLQEGSVSTLQEAGQPNLLRVDARGPDFFLQVNGEFLGLVSDPEYSDGQAGMYVETFDAPSVHIHYDSVTVREVEPPQFQCQVITQGIYFRTGPGKNYRAITSLTNGARVLPVGRSPDGLWLQVRREDGDQEGWVAYDDRFLACDPPVTGLPVATP